MADPVAYGAFAPRDLPEPEMRAYEPTAWERLKSGVNSVGRMVGYDDLAKRTGETFDLLSIPMMLSGLSAPSAAVARSGPAWDAAMARVLNRKYPDEKVITGGRVGGTEWSGLGSAGYWDSSKGLSRLHDIPKASKTNAIRLGPEERFAAPSNEFGSALSDSSRRYMDELIARKSRGAFGVIDGSK